jgi:hypothetical protein
MTTKKDLLNGNYSANNPIPSAIEWAMRSSEIQPRMWTSLPASLKAGSDPSLP